MCQPCYLPCSSAGPTGHAMIKMFSLSTPWISSLCGDGHARAGVEVLLTPPDRPHDAPQFIRHGDGRFVVAAPRRDGDRPVLKPRPLPFPPQRPLGREQDGARAVGQQTTQVDIAALADAPQVASEPARALAGWQPEPARKIPSAGKRVDVPDGAKERRCGDDAETRNREEAEGDGISLGEIGR